MLILENVVPLLDTSCISRLCRFSPTHVDIPTHQTSLISLLSLCSVDIAFFSDLNHFFRVMCCFIFPIPSPFFLCHFCFVILAVCNFSFLFASCLFFIPIFALFLIFLYRSAKLLSLSFFPLFIYQQPVTVF